MKKTLPLLAAALLSTHLAFAADTAKDTKPAEKPEAKAPAKVGKAKWHTSIEKARKQAAEEKKPIIMLFTGSDWCHWCIKLEKEILSQKEFKAWAGGNAVLFIADFPQGKKPGEKEMKQNRKLQGEYGVKGYPTIIVTDAEGKKLGQTGYQKMTPAEYTKHLEGFTGSAK